MTHPNRPSMPTPLTALYLIAILITVVSGVIAWAISTTDNPAGPWTIGMLLGGAVSAFVPALVTHAVVAAIYDLKWRSDEMGSDS